MKPPTVASRKKVTPENLATLGVERLAAILAAVADARPEVKRRLRMELAAEQGAEHLLPEIDRRLGRLETSRSKVPWRQRPTFVRDLDVLRTLISGRLAGLDPAAALERMWRFMELTRRLETRVRDRDGELAAVFERAAGDIGVLIGEGAEARTAEALADAIVRSPQRWAEWLPAVLETAPPSLAATALRAMSERGGAVAAWLSPLRQLADAAGDVDAYRSTFPAQALRAPDVAADVATRLLKAGRVDEAGEVLNAARAAAVGGRGPAESLFDWETAWIDYLDQSGRGAEAQAARWSSFERTLSAERARAFTRRLADFDDVEAEDRAFQHAAGHADFARGLRFLMDWPAPAEAARMIEARAGEVSLSAADADQWAAQLRDRYPRAAHALLRKAAAAAFRRREFAASDRLTRDADAILPE